MLDSHALVWEYTDGGHHTRPTVSEQIGHSSGHTLTTERAELGEETSLARSHLRKSKVSLSYKKINILLRKAGVWLWTLCKTIIGFGSEYPCGIPNVAAADEVASPL